MHYSTPGRTKTYDRQYRHRFVDRAAGTSSSAANERRRRERVVFDPRSFPFARVARSPPTPCSRSWFETAPPSRHHERRFVPFERLRSREQVFCCARSERRRRDRGPQQKGALSEVLDRSQSLFDPRRGGARPVANPMIGNEDRDRVLRERRPNRIEVLAYLRIEVGYRPR